nr:4a-hydroxytetrahydrobiopterin dehydratase [Nocardioides ginsengisegetis]
MRTHTDTVGAEGLDDWRWMLRALHARFRTGDFVTGLRLATAIAEAAEEMDHHPDLDLRYPHLNVRLSSHDVGGVTDRDLRLARRISELAAGVGVAADPSAVQVLELALDTADLEGVRPFWLAVLGMSETASPDELVDKGGSLPTLWFQETDPHDEPRQRFHVDITVPPEVAPGRIEAALAAGGTLVSAAREPAFTILADAEGNKACVCTSAGRD